MAKKITGYIKLQIPGEKQLHHLRLDLRWVKKVLISWSFVNSSTQELQIKTG